MEQVEGDDVTQIVKEFLTSVVKGNAGAGTDSRIEAARLLYGLIVDNSYAKDLKR